MMSQTTHLLFLFRTVEPVGERSTSLFVRRMRRRRFHRARLFPAEADPAWAGLGGRGPPPPRLRGRGSILEGINRERALLGDLRTRADDVIDTTNCSVHDLSRQIRDLVATESDLALKINVMSFGFKYGIPLDADYVCDVRFIPNPYWVGELRHLTGRDAPVAEYVFAQPGAAQFVDQYANLLVPVLPHYLDELKPNVTIAMGCTGGKHRSVASAERVAAHLQAAGFCVRTYHRDLGRE